MLTKEQCQKKIFNVAIKLGASPRLIATRLLSEQDKQDMLDGLISDEMLETAVKVWIDSGMCNYADGSGFAYKPSSEIPMHRHRSIGKSV